jgi:hypothetical protein
MDERSLKLGLTYPRSDDNTRTSFACWVQPSPQREAIQSFEFNVFVGRHLQLEIGEKEWKS